MKKHIIISCFAAMAVLAGSLDFAEAREHRGDRHAPHKMEQKFHHKKHTPHFMHKAVPHKPAPHMAMRPVPYKPKPFHKSLPHHHFHDSGVNLSLRLDNGYIRFGVIN